jgi:hypothetical protein
MPTIAACPNCDKKLKTPNGAEGRKIRCPGCKATLIVTEDGLVADEEEVRPRKGRSGRREEEDEAPRRSRRRADEEDEDERPRRRSRKRQGAGIPLWVWLTGGGVLAVALGVVLLVVLLGSGKTGKIKKAMTEKEVNAVLGDPFFKEGSRALYFDPPVGRLETFRWEDAPKVKDVYLVTFEGGKVKEIKREKADIHTNYYKKYFKH